MASRLERAAREAISELHSDSMSFDVLICAAADAKMVLEYGAEPHEHVNPYVNLTCMRGTHTSTLHV